MTSKERLAAAFDKKGTPDTVPIWMMFPFEQEPFAADVHNASCYDEVTRLVVERTDFIERNALTVDLCFSHPELVRERKENATEYGKNFSETISYRGVTFEQSLTKNRNGTTRRPFLRDIDELDALMEIPYQVPEVQMGPYREKARALGDKGLHGIQLIDPISVFHDICSETDFALWCYTHTDKVKSFLDVVHERVVAVYKQFLENDVGSVFWISGAEFLGPPMAPAEIFRELVTRYEKPIVEMIRDYGKKSLLHFHGRIYDVLDEIAAIGPDGIHPVEAPPMGDCTLPLARERLGDEIVLVGNIQYSDITSKSEGEITHMVKTAIAEAGKKNFVLSPTCTPYEEYITEKTAHNYAAMIKAGIEYGSI